MKGEWIRKAERGTSVIFVHGILSSGENCWLNNNSEYWPELLKHETELQAVGIYVFTYQTDIFSGSYRLSDVVDSLKEFMRLDGLFESEQIIFVAHSLGGIVARKFLVERATELIRMKIDVGLFLLASPSLGAAYANWLSPLARFLGHAQADALRFGQNNVWLNDLDKEFQNIKEAGELKIKGKELIEDKFIVLKKILRKQLVEPFSGARYFGEPFKVPGSDHFSIAKPASSEAIQHRLLCQFIKDRINELDIGSGQKPTKLRPRVVGSIPTDISHFTGRVALINTLSQFLRAEGSGVCTLLGLGGCGKSAVLKKFGQIESLFSPPNRNAVQDAVFSWSFSQDDSLDHFYAELQEYITPLSQDYNRSRESSPNSNPLILPDIIKNSGKRVLIFLDGLERIIDERYTENSKEGSVSTPALKALLQRASENECGSLRIFITTRVPIPDISNSDYESSITLDLNKMEEEDAIALLERSGARGEREQLTLAAREFKFHAYSIALLGMALAEEYRGDIRRRDRLMTNGSEGESPIGRLLVWYLHHLDKYSLCLLKAISIYRGSVSDSDVNPFLSAVAEKEKYVGLDWSIGQIGRVRSRLSRLGLIFVSDESTSNGVEKIDLHPIVRDFFYTLLLEPADLHERALEILSAAAPERPPAGAESIAVLVEMIYHAVRSHHYELAWTIYLERLGGYHNIGYSRAEHPLGSRIIYTFLDDSSFANAEVSDHIRTNLLMDGALYLKNEGRLDDAIDLLNAIRPNSKINPTWPDQFASLLLVKAGIELIRGRIPAAKRSIADAQIEFEKIREMLNQRASNRVEKECCSRLATALAVSADSKAIELFESAAKIPDHPDTVPHDHLPIGYGWYLMLRGSYDQAREVLREGLEAPLRLGAKMLVYRVQSIMVLNEAAAGKIEAAEAILHEITAWTLKPDLHIFILTWLMRAKIALVKQDYVEARSVASKGLKYAGDNGYVIEWIDLVLTLAEAAVFTKSYEEADRLAQLVLTGDNTSYSYRIPGASDKSVNYVWAALPANYIKALSDQRRTQSPSSACSELEAVRSALSQLGHPFLGKTATLEQE